jgi:hypothetical protein
MLFRCKSKFFITNIKMYVFLVLVCVQVGHMSEG